MWSLTSRSTRDLWITLHPLTQSLRLDADYHVATILTTTMQPLNRQISEWERVIKYYCFVTTIELQYNFLANEDQNGSGRAAITISLQWLGYNTIAEQTKAELYCMVNYWRPDECLYNTIFLDYVWTQTAKQLCTYKLRPVIPGPPRFPDGHVDLWSLFLFACEFQWMSLSFFALSWSCVDQGKCS